MSKDIEYQSKLSDVMLDRGEEIVIAGKSYEIKALKMRTRWLISECINKMELKEKDTINILESMFTDIPLLAKMITYAVLRDKENIENKELFTKTYDDILECEDMQEYLNAITTIIKLMDIEWFFFTQETVKSINILPSKAGYKEKIKEAKEQEYSMQAVNLVTLQE
jgi:hypothetical protein